ncbi:UNVERIFIED_CONTAM: hypothetical protein GTU68_040774, partial [Idotea baltica]|nr:hypothetical protein [Idotea baltica]
MVTKEDLMNTSVSQGRMEQPLSERLKYKSVGEVDFIPHQLVRKYICYARKYVKPKLTPSAAKVLQGFYLELRQKLQNSDSTP